MYFLEVKKKVLQVVGGLCVVVVQAIEHELRIVVDEGFLGFKQTQGTTHPLAYRVLGEASLEDVLEAQCFFVRSDVQQITAVITQRLKRHLLGRDDHREVTFTFMFT